MKSFPPALALAVLGLAVGAAHAEDAQELRSRPVEVRAVESLSLRGTCAVLGTPLSATYRGEVARFSAGGEHRIGVLEMEAADREDELASRLAWVHRAPDFAGGRRIERPIVVELGTIDATPNTAKRLQALGAGEIFGMDGVPVRIAVVCDLSPAALPTTVGR